MMVDLQGLLIKDPLRSLAGLEGLVKTRLKSFLRVAPWRPYGKG